MVAQYNDVSVLESYHAYQLFHVMSDDQCDMLAKLEAPVKATVRTTIVHAILATDMAGHAAQMKAFMQKDNFVSTVYFGDI